MIFLSRFCNTENCAQMESLPWGRKHPTALKRINDIEGTWMVEDGDD